MRKIYKYPVPLVDVQELTLPEGFQILSIWEQDGKLFLWADVDADPDAFMGKLVLYIYGTGFVIPDERQGRQQHLATVQVGNFVWHVYAAMR